MRRIIRSFPLDAFSAISRVSAVRALRIELVCHAFLIQVQQEQQRADTLVAVGEGMILHDEVEQVRRLLLAGAI